MLSTRHEDSPKDFLLRFWDAMLRIIGLFILILAHKYLTKSITANLPENMPWAKPWLEDISFVGFVLIYVYLLWDMLKIFIPWLQSDIYPGLEVSQDDEA
jgi:hypothetical protein